MKDVGTYALINKKSDIVENIIIANNDLKKDGCYLIRYSDKTFCQPGMYYNNLDGFFYDNKGFTIIRNTIENPSV